MPDDIEYIDIAGGLNPDEAELLEDILTDVGESRRKFIGQSSSAVLGALVLEETSSEFANNTR